MSLSQTFGDSAKTSSFMPAADRIATANGAGVDLTKYNGGIGIVLDSSGGGAATTMDVAIEDSADNVAFAPLLDKDGAAIAFAQVGNVASHQKIAFHRHLARSYIRAAIVIGGAGPSFKSAAVIVGV